MLSIRRQVFSFVGGAMKFVPELARQLAVLNLEHVMRVNALQVNPNPKP
jgi:hypothetical protein